MTYLVMDVAWGQVEGICVDTHVHRYGMKEACGGRRGGGRGGSVGDGPIMQGTCCTFMLCLEV